MPPRNQHDSIFEYRVSEAEKHIQTLRGDLDKHIERVEMLINRALGALLTISFVASAIGYMLSKL